MKREKGDQDAVPLGEPFCSLGRANSNILNKCSQKSKAPAKGEKHLKLKIVFITVTVILVVSLAANAYLYSEQYSLALNNGLQKQSVTDLQKQVADLQSQISNLSTETNNLQNENSHLLSQKTDLQNQIENLNYQTDGLQSENANLSAIIANFSWNRPNLITRLGASNVIESAHGDRPRLFVEGDVFNTGGATAHDAKLHITLFILGKIVGDVSIALGNMEPFSGVHISQDIYYDGVVRLTNWTIIPESS